LNEEEPIGDVVRAVPRGMVDEVLVVDNGSTDATAERARAAGARVVSEPRRGCGRACQAGIAAVAADCEVILFLDGDGSDCPELIPRLVEPILAGRQDFVIGSRIRGRREAGSMNPPQLLAGRVAVLLLRLHYGDAPGRTGQHDLGGLTNQLARRLRRHPVQPSLGPVEHQSAIVRAACETPPATWRSQAAVRIPESSPTKITSSVPGARETALRA
jgi:glycosyltransferase involved in cell wall biosynthesis